MTLDLSHLPDRQLERHELAGLVNDIADQPGRWESLVRYDDAHRQYSSLHRDSHVDIWLICWTPSNDTGWHDHDVSSGAVAVARGAIVEHNLAVGTPSLRSVVTAGQSFSFGPDHIHRMTGETGQEEGSVSVHAYSPPLWRMGAYAISNTGVLRRASVSYADELRPIEEPFPLDQARLRELALPPQYSS